MEKFMTASVRPNPATTAASRQARRRIRPDSAVRSGLAPTAAITAAAVHSRSPVTAAGAICVNSRAASPAPNWTEKMPVSTRAEGGTAVHGARRFPELVAGASPEPAAGASPEPVAGASPDPAASSCSWALGWNRHFPAITDRLLPAKQACGQRDADRGPDD